MRKLFSIALCFVLVCALLVPIKALAAFDPLDGVCNGGLGSDGTVCTDGNVAQTPGDNSIYGRNGIITKLLKLLSAIIGIASVIMLVIGGFKFVTAGGDPKQIAGARRTILFAVIGILVVLMAQAMILFVFNKL